MVFQALENMQNPSNEHPSAASEKILKPRGLHSVGAVIGGLGLGLLARQWLPSASSTLIIGSIVTTAGVLLMLFR